MKKNMSVMIIDDDLDDIKLFEEALAEIDQTITCTSANDGQEGLETLRNLFIKLPDLIFLDLRMPRINGKKFLNEIKLDPRLKSIPVAIYTTSRVVEESEMLKEMGALHFISKPTNPEELYYLLSVVLEEFDPGIPES